MQANDGLTKGSTVKALRNTMVLGVILALVTAPVHSGFMLFFTIPLFAVWLIQSLAIMLRDPERRRIQLTTIAFWIALVALICALHAWYAYSARHYAEDLVAKVEKFEAGRQRCPKSIEELGMTRTEMTKKLGYSGYYCEEDGKPHLFHAATFVVFETYHYDFAKKTWAGRNG